MAYKSKYQNTGSNFQNVGQVYQKQENRISENEKMSSSNHNRIKRSAHRHKKRKESKVYRGESIDSRTKKIAVCSKWLDFYHQDLSVRWSGLKWFESWELIMSLLPNYMFIPT